MTLHSAPHSTHSARPAWKTALLAAALLSTASTFLATFEHFSPWLRVLWLLGLPGTLVAANIASDITQGEPFWVLWLAGAINAVIYFLPLLGIVKLSRLLRGQAR